MIYPLYPYYITNIFVELLSLAKSVRTKKKINFASLTTLNQSFITFAIELIDFYPMMINIESTEIIENILNRLILLINVIKQLMLFYQKQDIFANNSKHLWDNFSTCFETHSNTISFYNFFSSQLLINSSNINNIGLAKKQAYDMLYDIKLGISNGIFSKEVFESDIGICNSNLRQLKNNNFENSGSHNDKNTVKDTCIFNTKHNNFEQKLILLGLKWNLKKKKIFLRLVDSQATELKIIRRNISSDLVQEFNKKAAESIQIAVKVRYYRRKGILKCFLLIRSI